MSFVFICYLLFWTCAQMIVYGNICRQPYFCHSAVWGVFGVRIHVCFDEPQVYNNSHRCLSRTAVLINDMQTIVSKVDLMTCSCTFGIALWDWQYHWYPSRFREWSVLMFTWGILLSLKIYYYRYISAAIINHTKQNIHNMRSISTLQPWNFCFPYRNKIKYGRWKHKERIVESFFS